MEKSRYTIKIPGLDPLKIDIVIHRDGNNIKAYRIWSVEPDGLITGGIRAVTTYHFHDEEGEEYIHDHEQKISIPLPSEVIERDQLDPLLKHGEYELYSTSIEVGEFMKTDGYAEICISESKLHPRRLMRVLLAEKISFEEAMRFVAEAREKGWEVKSWRYSDG